MKICIVAAGLATRLQPLTNYIPKFLVNIGKQTGFVEMIRYWGKYSNDFTIIVHPKYESLTKEYFNLYFKTSDFKLTIKTCETSLGTAHTIDTSLGIDYEGEEILFTWCDVIPSNDIDLPELEICAMHGDGIIAFTVDNGLNRYKFESSTLVKSNNGDVIGIYYLEKYRKELMLYKEGDDFADVLSKHFINKFPLRGVIDYGDLPKLNSVRELSDDSREFNAIFFDDTKVCKKALNEQGYKLIHKELNWYAEVHFKNIDVNSPTIYFDTFKSPINSYGGAEILMSRIDNSIPMYKIFSTSGFSKFIMLQNIETQLNLLSEKTEFEVKTDVVIRDILQETQNKLVTRYDEIKSLIECFGKNITKVNGLKIKTDVYQVITELSNRICEHYSSLDNTYSLIHGDIQMSNVLVDLKTLEVSIIDPRGYFGLTELYGLKDYDQAKILYALSGYDLFNYSTDFHIKNLSRFEIEFDIPTQLGGDELDTKILSRYKPIHYLWLAVIWLGLAQYIKNNPVKSLAAHYHGLYLATKFLDNDFTL